jgi:caa(3)-type oxidase subunit IV
VATARTSYGTYWRAWGSLLALTAVMVVAEGVRVPRLFLVAVLVTAMLAKAAIIGGWFMHLRFERAPLVVSVVLATFVTAAALFGLIAPDGVSMLRLAPR